jgi:L-seryl-tRNA(Ser) seleniumtransferase
LQEVSSGYCNLELDLNTGKRGQRSSRIEELLCLLTRCEAAIVVNNNAGSVLLAVSALSRDRDVVVSRGELIEIGGSFRLPEVIIAAGGKLKEIGTTNRTRISDYRDAVSSLTGMFLKCHRSNFEITGFTEEASLPELVQLSLETGVPLVEDLGSGVLIDIARLGLNEEFSIEAVVESGCDLVTFSGDKLLGGPQAGLIVGKRALVDKLRKHPLYRALRADKMVLAAMESILIAYLAPHAETRLPALHMAAAPITELKERTDNFAQKANQTLTKLKCRSVVTCSTAGGGSLPGQTLESFGISLESEYPASQLSAMLRNGTVPVIAIVQDNRTLLDFRTITSLEESTLLEVLRGIDSSQIKGI